MKEVPISRKKEVLKKNRGYLEVALMSNQGKEKAVVAWKDNGTVIMASNCFGSEPIRKAKRWDRKERKKFFRYVFLDILQWEVLTVKINPQITGY